jgi:hypothetical protein
MVQLLHCFDDWPDCSRSQSVGSAEPSGSDKAGVGGDLLSGPKAIRAGKQSCWGIVIKFDGAVFKTRVLPSQLQVFEAKHGANLLNLMTWHTSRDRKQLTIKFKPGTGDFGSGNKAEITLYKTAFTLPPKDFPEYMVIVQRTDIN